ncbi:MAG: virulence factor [Phenylobacterium zucineum]|nr:MAG: virulence factor [Phenylobacterium zucineum]
MRAIGPRSRIVGIAAFCVLAFATLALALGPLGAAVVEVPTQAPGDTLAILYSGDGGWAPLDRGVVSALAARGVPVVGVNSVRYFWTRRTPESGAGDLADLARRYMTAWGRRRLVLIGYSFGAGALPPLIAGLPPDVKSRIRYVALVSPEAAGVLRFRPSGWFGQTEATTFPLAPAVARLGGLHVACLYGAAERLPGCKTLPPGAAVTVKLPGGHHFDGDFAGLAAAILRLGRP